MEHLDPADDQGAAYWALQGAKGIASAPALILITAFVGFAGLSREAGLT
ncbi:hypothetical protein [Aurantimonas aggregata]